MRDLALGRPGIDGSTDLLLQLWIGASGAIQRAQLLDAPDDRARENTFASALRGVSIGVVPPAGLPQPITMAILARTGSEAPGCAGAATQDVHWDVRDASPMSNASRDALRQFFVLGYDALRARLTRQAPSAAH